MANIRNTSIIQPCPPSNPDCHCKEIHTPEGTYSLIREIFQESTQPQFTTGTHVSFFDTIVQHQHNQQQYLSLPTYRKSSSQSLLSDQTLSENDNSIMSSLDEEDGEDNNFNNNTEIIPAIVLSNLSTSVSDNRGLVAPTLLEPTISDSQLITTQQNIPSPGEDTAPVSGGSSFSLFGHSRSSSSGSHRKKPKTSLSKLKSSFIEYITTGEHFSKSMDSGLESNIFYNIGVNFFWDDELSESKTPLSKLTFARAYITCHDVNQVTSNKNHLNVIIGFSTGDIVWYDTVCNRYTRINKNGIMNGSSVTMVKWVPGSEDLFMASFDDGSILVLDKERDDQSFSVREPQSWAEEHFQITKPHSKHSKHNPVAHWRVSQKGITAFAFSPNHKYVATVGKDGLMRTIDYTNERLCDVFVGYYGRLLCIAWSPDGEYILTGGQDDLVSIWSFKETRIIARCQGHRSWVTGVAFDPLHSDDKESYRFASVGDDCKLLLWDFSVNALHKPKQKSKRLSMSFPNPMPLNEILFKYPITKTNVNAPTGHTKKTRKRSSIFGSNTTTASLSESLLQPTKAAQHVRLPTIHPALSKCQVPFLQPIVKQTIHPDPCVDIVFRNDSIVTTDRRGRIRTWRRSFNVNTTTTTTAANPFIVK